jgi:hypothetical protein
MKMVLVLESGPQRKTDEGKSRNIGESQQNYCLADQYSVVPF